MSYHVVSSTIDQKALPTKWIEPNPGIPKEVFKHLPLFDIVLCIRERPNSAIKGEYLPELSTWSGYIEFKHELVFEATDTIFDRLAYNLQCEALNIVMKNFNALHIALTELR